jgi:general secretion pathway protein E
MSHKRLGELLLDKALIRQTDLETALSIQGSMGGVLGLILVRVGAISENDLLAMLSEQLDLPIQSREEMPSPAELEAFLEETRTTHAWWVERQAVAWRPASDEPDEARLVCAAVHPLDPTLRGLMEQHADLPIEWRLCPRTLIAAALEDVREEGEFEYQGGVADAARLRELAEEAPVIEFVNGVLAEALQRRASDIHVEPFEDKFTVRMRVDGILYTVRTAPRASFDAVCSRIKLLSGMDIGERRLPQDGRQAVRISGQEVDLRVSSLPAAWGESMVLRLLGKTSKLPELAELGLTDTDAVRLHKIVDQPNGIVLVTGPTGSGKTTTIYRLLTGLNDGVRKIITIEDPVELDLPGVIQVQAKADIGLTFAAGLRSILRQDPDIIMVGEIRDPETARIAVQAALTGHVVISTVHTNSGLAAIARLLDLGVEDYLLADVMRGVVGQRLVRKLCPHCSRPSDAQHAQDYLRATPRPVLRRLRGETPDWREPVGCGRCGGGGYQGRIGVFEIAPFSAAISGALRRRATEAELLRLSRHNQTLTMFEDGVLKAAQGLTSMTEVFRVLGVVDPESEDGPADTDLAAAE